jgi:hypothetical protein
MKKIILILLLFVSLCIKAQVQTNNLINKFVGTWQWVSNTDTVKIVLEKQVYNLQLTGVQSEILVGWHKYVKNGVVIENSMQYVGLDINTDYNSSDVHMKTTLSGTSRGANKAWFDTFWSLTELRSNELSLEMLPNSTTQAKWKLKGSSPMPSDLILTKQ